MAVLNSLGYTDILMVGGIAAIIFYLWSSKRRSSSTIVDLKKLKIAPTFIDDGLSVKDARQEKSLLERMKASGKNIDVFFGSQTGTAEEFAQRLSKNARLYGLKALVVDPEEIDINEIPRLTEIPNALAVFILATYGEGDPTDNAQELHEQLQQDNWDLNGLKYAVFGLGNKTYEHYNEIGKYFDKRLEQLNGSRLVQLGLGDDDANIEEDFVTWMDKFWTVVCDHFGISASEQDISIRQYKLLNHDDVPNEKVFKGEVLRLNSYNRQKP